MAEQRIEKRTDRRRENDRRVLRVDRRITPPEESFRGNDELGFPLPDRRRVFGNERRGTEDDRRSLEAELRRGGDAPVERKVYTCVYVDNYKFHECTIKSCKNFTDVTRSKCLAIDRVQPVGNKIISDAELHLYKFGKEKVSTRLISIKRKKAITRVKAILILHSFIEYIRDNHRPKKRAYEGKLIEKLELDYPLKVRKLQFYNWMWPYLTSKKVWKKFTTKKGGECAAFKVHMLLNLTRMKYETLIKQLKEESNVSSTKSNDNQRTGKLQGIVGMGNEQLQSKR